MKKIISGGTGEFTDKKSRFIANIYHIEDEDMAVKIIEQLRKKYWDARHNCYAYVLGDKSEIQRFSDDGEPSGTAGKPILEVITGNECGNCLCVVTRYFGGVLLGTGGLIRAYTIAAKEALAVCRLGELTEGVHAFLDVDYNYVGKVQYICAQNDITIVNTEYADGVTFELMMENARKVALSGLTNLVIRVPVIPTFNDTVEEIQRIAGFADTLPGVNKIHLLPYHRLGQDKYEGLGRTYLMGDIEPPSKEHMETLKKAVHAVSGLDCQIGG